MRFPAALLSILALAFSVAACGGDGNGEASAEPGGDAAITIYSGREEELVGPLFERFERESGVDLEVRYGDSAELAATIAEEGENSPADVFFAQDPGSLGAVEAQDLLLELPDRVLERVPERFRDPDGRWVGTSGRVRVLAYSTEALTDDELPATVFELAAPEWRGRIGFPPTNASFQAFVTAMRLTKGEERTRDWLEAIAANEPKLYENNISTVEAVAAGEIDVGLVNHYYLYLVKEEQPDAPVENHFFSGADPGALVSVAGAAVLAGADEREAAVDFVDFLLSDEGQRFYAEEAEEAEYPLVAGISPRAGLPPLDTLEGPKLELDELGPELERTLELLSEVGLTS
jgi:iron(III) transport system substrate-binding protein